MQWWFTVENVLAKLEMPPRSYFDDFPYDTQKVFITSRRKEQIYHATTRDLPPAGFYRLDADRLSIVCEDKTKRD